MSSTLYVLSFGLACELTGRDENFPAARAPAAPIATTCGVYIASNFLLLMHRHQPA